MSSKRCPNGYHRNKNTGRCVKKTVIDEGHKRLQRYIESGDMEAVKEWLRNEGLDYRKLCDDSSSDDEEPNPFNSGRTKKTISDDDDDDDDEEPKRSKLKNRTIVDSEDDDSEDSDGPPVTPTPDLPDPKFKVGDVLEYADGSRRYMVTIVGEAEWDEVVESYYYRATEEQSGIGSSRVITVYEGSLKKNSSPPVTPTQDLIDLTLSDEEEELSCGIQTTIDKVAVAFVEEYAPWTKHGLSRAMQIKTSKTTQTRQAYLVFYNEREYNKDKKNYYLKVMRYSIPRQRWVWQDGYELKNTDFEGIDRWTREFYRTGSYPEDLFHKGKNPKKVSGVLKLYVWDRGDKYTIAGEHLKLELIFKHLPKNFTFSDKNNTYWTAKEQRKHKKNTSYDYSKTAINLIELRAFQVSVNNINDHFKDAVLSTTAPYLDPNYKPNELRQIMGWDVEAKFPDHVKQYIRLNTGLLPLGHCGPIRTRGSTNEVWRYRFGIHGTPTGAGRDITQIIARLFPQIFRSKISLSWREGNLHDLRQIGYFLADPYKTIAFVSWGTQSSRITHERIFVKRKSKTNPNWSMTVNVLDPWMQGTRKHRRGYDEIEKFVASKDFSGIKYALVKVDRPAEQAYNEGSCTAITFSRGIALATLGYDRGITGDIEAWIPVFIKMLYNKYSPHAAAENRATKGGNFKLKL